MATERTCILVSSPDSRLARMLEAHLPQASFEIVAVQPGAAFVSAVRRHRPRIALLDRVHERADSAQMEIAVLKDAYPKVRIIAVSQEPTSSDAKVVEQGLFYYLSAPVADELLRVVRAAAGVKE